MTNMRFNHEVLIRIVEGRKLSATDVVTLTGLTPSQVHNLLNKKVLDPRSGVVNRLAAGLDVEWPIFYGLDFQKKKTAV